MAALASALPARMRGAHAADSSALLPPITEAVATGDVVLVKGSLGSRMGLVVEALTDMACILPRAANGE
jgi:UDP-N-acetylmuramoyl-tripeptide--D-alanyl-D-alanine ligase